MNVSVKEFRNSVDHLYRMANVDYHACVGAQELRYWVERVERVIGLVEALECKRAKPADREEHRKSLEAARKRLEQAAKRIQELEQPEPKKPTLTLCVH
ncbi:hypothetical protein CF042_05825 [Klebsiella pneumoniae]|uniref:hypothetical protein n=1 Tax=Klebsiella pneumoniae TaxID=573 RepID=UPI001C8192B6|nr:hypothetical protein [Klebsiella pneumoniae]MBX4558863.1 hypothetical protein [Klebsiella pneumoniae]